MIYADYNATGPLLPEVGEAMAPWLESQFGNSASTHYPLGKQAAEAVERAREQVAELVSCNPGEVVFTSGGTESCFLALVWSPSSALAKCVNIPVTFRSSISQIFFIVSNDS